MGEEAPRRPSACGHQNRHSHRGGKELSPRQGVGIGGTRGAIFTSRAAESLESGLATAVGTGNNLANPADRELNMATAALAGALEITLHFGHELQPIYATPVFLNTEKQGSSHRLDAARNKGGAWAGSTLT